MLGVAITFCSSGPGPLLPSCWSPGWCWGTRRCCPGRGTCMPPSQLQVQPVAKLSTCPRDTHTGHWLGRSHALPQMRHHLQQYLHTGPTFNTSTGSHVPFSSWADRDKRSLVQAQTQDSLDAQAHAHSRPLCLPSTPAPIPVLFLPVSGATYLLAGPAWCLLQTRSTHTHPTGILHSQVTLDNSMDLCLPDTPVWTQQLLLTGESSLKFASEWDAHPLWGRYWHSPSSAASIRHMSWDPRSHSSCWHWAPHSPHPHRSLPVAGFRSMLFPPQQSAPVANTETSLAPVVGTTGRGHSHSQSDSICWCQIHSHRTLSSWHFILTTHIHMG